jgi:flagellar hook-associated protein 3 FlgL
MLIRSTLFSRLSYMSRENTELATKLADVQKQIATGKRLVRMSDEPWTISQLHQLREETSVQSVFKDSANQATTLLAQAENGLSQSLNVMSRLKALSVQSANDTYSAENLVNLAEEVGNLKERLVNLANTEFNGRYVFSGQAYDTVPFDSTFTYVGSTNEFSMDVSAFAKVEAGFDGSDVFQGSVDVFTAIDNFITGLNTDDSAIIQNAITDFDAVFDKMANYLTRIGGEVNIAEDMYDVATSIEMNLTERLSSVEDVDVAEALTRFSMLQTQYQINLQLTAKTRGLSLFERM